MTPERWRRVEELYHAALTRGESDRPAFLASACGGDEALRREVESLLAQPPSALEFLDDPAVAMAAQLVSDIGVSVLSGRRLGAYQVHERIGVGGMGEVYRARDTRLGRDVAIKILPRAFTADPDRLARFEREARVLATLNHPHIGAIYGFEDGPAVVVAAGAASASGDAGPLVKALVLELVEGETLAERIGRVESKRARLSVKEALAIARQIADALDAAHEKGIVHRDLKPANIKIARDGVVKVLDFGLAKTGSTSANLTRSPTMTLGGTREGIILGTAGYMSPEQARGQAVDKRTDIWAFGCVLFEMLTGVPAFGRATISETIAAVIEREPHWDAVPDDTPSAVRHLLERCLEKDLKRRQRDIGDARRDLEVVLEPGPEPPSRSATRSAAYPWIAAGLLGLLAATGWWTAMRGGAESPPATTLTLDRMTWTAGLSTEPALSPDGSLIVYASDNGGQGNLDLWLQRVAGGTPVRLTQDPADDREPAISPDGTSIAFRSERNGGGVYVMPALGGDARLVAPQGRRPRFSPDGTSIVYWTGPWLGGTRVPGTALFIVPANGGAPRRLAPGFITARSPIWSPDGRSVLFFGRKGGDAGPAVAPDEAFDWWWVPASGADPVKTGAYPTMIARGISFNPAWELDSLPEAWTSKGVLFSATVAQASNLWQLKISETDGKIDGPLVRVTSGTGADIHPSVDRNGRIAFEVTDSTESVFQLALDPNAGRSLNRIDRLASDWGYTAHRGSVSQNGRTLAYPKYRPTLTELWAKDLTTNVERHLATTPPAQLNPTVSPDGTQVAYVVLEKAHFSGYVVPSAGGAVRRVCDDCQMNGWLKDNRRILVEYPSKRPSLRLLDTVTLETADVFDSPGPLNRVLPTPDDRWLATGAADLAWIAPLRPGTAATPATSHEVRFEKTDVTPGRVCGWSPDGRLLYSLLGLDGFRCLYAQRVDPERGEVVGKPFIVHHFHDPQRMWGSTPMSNAIVPGGFVFDQLERSGSIWLLNRAETAAATND